MLSFSVQSMVQHRRLLSTRSSMVSRGGLGIASYDMRLSFLCLWSNTSVVGREEKTIQNWPKKLLVIHSLRALVCSLASLVVTNGLTLHFTLKRHFVQMLVVFVIHI